MKAPDEKKVQQVIDTFRDKYEKALALEWVKNPIAYALYHTWKQFDK